MATKPKKTEGQVVKAGKTAAKPETKPAAKVTKAVAPAPKRNVTVRVPVAAKRKAAKPVAPKPRTAKKADEGFSTEVIALRAYFISQNRAAAGLDGDELSDWLEAERQLNAERK